MEEGWRFLLDEADCSGKFLRHFARLYYMWFYNFSWLFLCLYLKYDGKLVKSFFLIFENDFEIEWKYHQKIVVMMQKAHISSFGKPCFLVVDFLIRVGNQFFKNRVQLLVH